MGFPSLSIVIPTHDTRELTLRCIGSMHDGGIRPAEVIVVDDASSDGTGEAVRASDPTVVVATTENNVGFSGAANLGIGMARGDLILVLNSDTELLEGGLASLVAAFSDNESLGIGGAELLAPDGRPQWRAGRWPSRLWLLAQSSGLGSVLGKLPARRILGGSGIGRSGDVDWVSGAAMAIRREVWQSCGPFDTGYRFYCQDIDLCRAARREGWSVAVVRGFGVLHHLGASISSSPGATGSFHPAHLWSDLVRFVAKYDGPEAAEAAASALRTGARLRLVGRSVAGVFSGGGDAWNRHTDAYREGLNVLEERLNDR